jgi:signal transduction histidine kinase/CheY-like chemotaxis protein
MHVARAVCTAFGWDWGAFWALDRKSGGLRYLAGRHIPGRRLEGFLETSRSMVFPAGAGLPGKVMASGNPAWVADLAKTGEQCPRLSAALQAGLRSAIVLPVTTQGAFAGIFEFMHAESFEPDLELLGVLGAMASQLGQFLGRKRAEEERLAAEDQFRQSQKMEAIGRLAGGVAHDFNNLLTVISGYGELLLDQDAIAGEDREKLIAICHAAEKASALTRQLLAFSRREDVKLRPLDLNAVVSDTQKMLKRLIGEDIELVTAPDPALGKVMADPGQITQVIMNLAVNARDAMPKGGRLMIETANVELDEAYASEHGGVRAGEYVMLAVSDTGTGMDAETRARIFEPYFTTKAVGKGTGLGLATVYGAVRQLKGHVFVYSELGRGTSFKIYLPRLPRYAGPEEAGVQEPAPAAAPRTGTVLVVEDEAPVRGFTCEVLRAHGHAVLAAAGPEEAIALAAGPGSEIDLLLTDVIMPGMTGVELARRLIPSHPRMRVLLTSGYTEHSEAVQQGLGKALFIQKPFTPGALARKVSEALGGE